MSTAAFGQGRDRGGRHPLIRLLARVTLRTNGVLRADLYRGMSFMLEAGRTDREALRTILLAEGRERFVPSPYQVAIPEFLYRLETRGEEWHHVLADWVPIREALAFSSAASLSAKRLADLADDIDRRSAILRTARTAALPFVFAVVFVSATLYAFGAYLFPEFEGIGITDWSGPVALLRSVSIWFAGNWLAVLVASTVAIVLYVLALPRLTGPGRRLLDVLPGTGIYALAVGLDWLSVMANLMQANVRHMEACRILRPYATPYLRARLDAILAKPQTPLADALAAHDDSWPSRRVVRLLSIINHSDQPFDAIRRVVDQEIGALDRRIRAATETVHAFTQVVMVLFVLFLMLLTFQISSQPLV